MSNLAVKGNIAGLGTVTIETPDTAVNRTLALPDVDGTVHTSGGVNDHSVMPTVGGDPVVESGSNSDGGWTRWADGTQVCRSDLIISGTFSESRSGRFGSASGNIYFIDTPIAFPIAFVDAEYAMVVSKNENAGGVVDPIANQRTTVGTSVRWWNYVTTSENASYIATGRWK